MPQIVKLRCCVGFFVLLLASDQLSTCYPAQMNLSVRLKLLRRRFGIDCKLFGVTLSV